MRRRLKLLWRVAPKPAEGVGKNDAAVVGVVGAFTEDVFVIVIFFLEGGDEPEVADDPVPAGLPAAIVLRAVLDEDTDGPGIAAENEVGIFVAAADVREAADVAHDFAALIGPLPRDGEV